MLRQLLRKIPSAALSVPLLLFLFSDSHAVIQCSEAAPYYLTPPFLTSGSTPNVMILLSNSHTSFSAGYPHTNSTTPCDNLDTDPTYYNDSKEYYGYFDPQKEYTYTGSSTPQGFKPIGYMETGHIPSRGGWSGNFLNWLTMSHVDFIRKALTGGKRGQDSDRTMLERANIPNDDEHKWSRCVKAEDVERFTGLSSSSPVTFTNVGTTFFVDSNQNKVLDSGETGFYAAVEVCVDETVNGEDIHPEGNCIFYDNGSRWKPEGLLQKFRDLARIGIMSYTHNTATIDKGGAVRVNIQDISDEINPTGNYISNSDGIIGYINSFEPKSWDPLAEMYYEAIRYFKHIGPTSGFCPSSPDPPGGFKVLCDDNGGHRWEDPILTGCEKNVILIINDEYPSRDSNDLPGANWTGISINNDLGINVTTMANEVGSHEGVSGLGQMRGILPSEPDSEGSYYIGGLARYALLTDLRSDFDDDQHIITFAIALRASPGGYQVPPPPKNPLYLATKYGGFDDSNENGWPDPGEWEGKTEGDVTWPKNFAHAESGEDFEQAMLEVFSAITAKTSSGTGGAIVTSSERGLGQFFQAYFEPSHKAGTEEARWVGFLHSLWIDAYGNLREDTNGDHRLVLTSDKIVQLLFKESQNKTVVRKYPDANGDGIADDVTPEESDLANILPIWEGCKALGLMNINNRNIKTFIDKDLDGSVDSGEYADFSSANKNSILPFLGLADPTDLDNLITYIRGTDVAGWRNRTVASQKYLLGDIVYSNPTPVDRPAENYDTIYGDKTYLAYWNKYKNRPTHVYAGANDGMLHAFYGGIFHSGDDPSTGGVAESAYIEVESGKVLGEEVWAYIPNNLLPHLKWLTCPDYRHVYYVDLKPKVVDARIFSESWNDPNSVHPYGWGTILIGGFRLGGSTITISKTDFGSGSKTSRAFKSAYFAMDITDPTNPQLLWEKTYSEMGYTMNYPCIIRIQNGTATPSTVAYADQKWMLVIGNGPTESNGSTRGRGYVYIIDLETGDLLRRMDVSNSSQEFMAPAASVDLNVNYDVDVIYLGSVTKSGSQYGGAMYRIATDSNDSEDTPDWVTNISNWSISKLIDTGRPITAAPGVSQIKNDIMVYFGTGRYIGSNDKNSTDLQKFYGIQDPCSFNYGSCSTTVMESNLANVTNIKVYENGTVTGLASGSTWNDLLQLFTPIDNYGFLMNLEQPTGAPSERVLVKPAIIGGLCIFSSFFPSSDPCAFAGDSRLYALYYKSGTAFKEEIIGTKTDGEIKKYVNLGTGLPSQVAIHLGEETGGTTLTQLSTSAIINLKFNAAEKMKSGFISWQELE